MEESGDNKWQELAAKTEMGFEAEMRSLRSLEKEMTTIVSKAASPKELSVAEFTKQLEVLEKEREQRDTEERQRQQQQRQKLKEEAALEALQREREEDERLAEAQLRLQQREAEYQHVLQTALVRKQEAAINYERKLQQEQDWKRTMDQINATIQKGYATLSSNPNPNANLRSDFDLPFSSPPTAERARLEPGPSSASRLALSPLPFTPMQTKTRTKREAEIEGQTETGMGPERKGRAETTPNKLSAMAMIRDYKPIRSFSKKIVAELEQTPLYQMPESEDSTAPKFYFESPPQSSKALDQLPATQPSPVPYKSEKTPHILRAQSYEIQVSASIQHGTQFPPLLPIPSVGQDGLAEEKEEPKWHARSPGGIERERCRICGLNACDAALIPCGHMGLCYDCCDNLLRCPFCQRSVKDKLRVFHP